MTIGHQNTSTIELIEVLDGSGKYWEIRYLENQSLKSARALTSATYQRILKDLNKIFPNQKSSELCEDHISITKTIRDGLIKENICSSHWSKVKRENFVKIYNNLKNLSSGKIPIYE